MSEEEKLIEFFAKEGFKEFDIDDTLKELEAKIEKLKEMNDLGELVLSYSILSDICKLKATEILEEGIKLEEVSDWKKKSVIYKELEKEMIKLVNIKSN